jgi:hypothetical protein
MHAAQEQYNHKAPVIVTEPRLCTFLHARSTGTIQAQALTRPTQHETAESPTAQELLQLKSCGCWGKNWSCTDDGRQKGNVQASVWRHTPWEQQVQERQPLCTTPLLSQRGAVSPLQPAFHPQTKDQL